MKIRTALTLRYTCITAAVFLVFITAIYYVSEHSRSNAFFRNLKSEAITKAHLFLNNQVDAETMQSIYLNLSLIHILLFLTIVVLLSYNIYCKKEAQLL